MAKYCVDIEVRGYYTVEVEADCFDEAKREAEYMFGEADFGELEDIDGDVCRAENIDNVAEVYYY